MILVKVSAPAEKRAEILAIIQPFRATVVDVAPSSITVQMTEMQKRAKPLFGLFVRMGLKKTSPAPVQLDFLLEINSHLNIVNPP